MSVLEIVRQVGLKRVSRHFIFSLWQTVFDFLPFSPLRVFWLKVGGATIGKNCVVDKVDFINLDRTGLKGLKVGQWSFLGRGALIDLAGQIILADRVIISPRVSIYSHMSVGFKSHPLFSIYPPVVGVTRIKSASFIGANSVILANTVIGPKSLIAAGSVVTGKIPAKVMAAGVPAKVKQSLKI